MGRADEIVRQWRKLSIRHRNQVAVPFLEPHRRGCRLDLDDAFPFAYLDRATAGQTQTVAHRLRDDDAAGSINGGLHGRRLPSVGRPTGDEVL